MTEEFLCRERQGVLYEEMTEEFKWGNDRGSFMQGMAEEFFYAGNDRECFTRE